MLVLVSERLTQAGAAAMALALAADLGAHAAGWYWAEAPAHGAVVSAMVAILAGVTLRGIYISAGRKERVHASR